MIKKLTSIFLSLTMVTLMLPTAIANAANNVTLTNPTVTVKYSKSVQSVSRGSIRHIAQMKSYSSYWNPDYFGKFESVASSECQTTSISMALSYLGVNMTPADLGQYWQDKYGGSGADFTTMPGDVNGTATATTSGDFNTLYNRYETGGASYSPVIIHLNSYSSDGHYVVVAGRTSTNTYTVVDPAQDNTWSINISKNSSGNYNISYTKNGSNKSETVSSSGMYCKQYYKAGSVSTPLSINPVSYPTTIKKGSSFNLTGTVTSNYKITQFKGEILQGSTVKQTQTTAPNATSVNIQSSAVNANLLFNTLAAGTYTLKYTAKDSSGASKTWSKDFTVTDSSSQTSTLSINPSSYPTTIKKGSSFNLTGTVTSNYKITQFKGEILQGSTVKQTQTTAPNATSVNIQSSAVNAKLLFDTLPAGSYTLKYTAKDASGASKTWSKNFTVTDSSSAASTLSINPSSYPTTITKGSAFNLTGTVTSNYNITQFKGEILQGSTVKQTQSTVPNAKSVNIQSSAVNYNLLFDTLPAGTYTLKYTAKDTSGNTKTWSKSFTVK